MNTAALGVHHIALRSRAVDACVAFYTQLLSLPVDRVHRTESNAVRSVWIVVGGVIVMIEQAEPTEPAPARGDMAMVAFAIDPRARDQVRARCRAMGVAIESETGFTLYVRDPEGRRVGLSHYPAPAVSAT